MIHKAPTKQFVVSRFWL